MKIKFRKWFAYFHDHDRTQKKNMRILYTLLKFMLNYLFGSLSYEFTIILVYLNENNIISSQSKNNQKIFFFQKFVLEN
jgi:hypothetical protein